MKTPLLDPTWLLATSFLCSLPESKVDSCQWHPCPPALLSLAKAWEKEAEVSQSGGLLGWPCPPLGGHWAIHLPVSPVGRRDQGQDQVYQPFCFEVLWLAAKCKFNKYTFNK